MAKRAICRQTPEVGAQCVNCARWDLCGGRPVMGVPTAITPGIATTKSIGSAVSDLVLHAPAAQRGPKNALG